MLRLLSLTCICASVHGQGLNRAKLTFVDLAAGGFEVAMAAPSPGGLLRQDASNWLITAIDATNRTSRTSATPAKAEDRGANITFLLPATPLDPAKFIYRVEWLPSLSSLDTKLVAAAPAAPSPSPAKPAPAGASFPFVPLAQGDKASSAAVDITGGAQAAARAVPNYFWDARVRYMKFFDNDARLGLQFDGKANRERNLDPDTMRAGARFEHGWETPGTWLQGIELYSNPLAFEFQRRSRQVKVDGTSFNANGRNANWISGGEFWLLPRKVRTRNIDPALIVGFEGGGVIDRFEYDQPAGVRFPSGIARPIFGANITMLKKNFADPVSRIDVVLDYRVRLPLTDEPFTFVDRTGALALALHNRPRHFGKADFGFTFTPSLSLTVGYRWGSLPPNFMLVRHQVNVGLTLRLKQRK